MTKQEKIIKEELQEAQYIGEDGGMIIDIKYPLSEAIEKMRQRVIADCGPEYSEWQLEELNEENVGIGWLHLVKTEDKHKYEEDIEWYVSIKDRSPYGVWTYWG